MEVSLALRNRLDSLQKEFSLYGEPHSKTLEESMMDNVNVNALQFEASVMDGPIINSRAGLCIYINAMVLNSHGPASALKVPLRTALTFPFSLWAALWSMTRCCLIS